MAIVDRHSRGELCQAGGALYLFPKLDPKLYPIADDQQFIPGIAAGRKVLLVQGSGFNWPTPDHFRVVFLPNTDDLTGSDRPIARFPGIIASGIAYERAYRSGSRSAPSGAEPGLLAQPSRCTGSCGHLATDYAAIMAGIFTDGGEMIVPSMMRARCWVCGISLFSQYLQRRPFLCRRPGRGCH